LRRLEEAFALAKQGRGRIVALAGEAGTGKSTLVNRFVERAAIGVHVYRGACENLTTPEALLPLRDIARASGAAFNAAADHLQAFEWLLNLLGDPGAVSILVVEDLHWADSVTLDLIRYLARRIGRLRVLVLLTYRDEEVDARSPIRALLGEAPPGIVARETLEPLSLEAVIRVAKSVGRNGADLFALTAGNPFLVTETLAVEEDAPIASVRDATLARAARRARFSKRCRFFLGVPRRPSLRKWSSCHLKPVSTRVWNAACSNSKAPCSDSDMSWRAAPWKRALRHLGCASCTRPSLMNSCAGRELAPAK
jgi:hypothetical protein